MIKNLFRLIWAFIVFGFEAFKITVHEVASYTCEITSNMFAQKHTKTTDELTKDVQHLSNEAKAMVTDTIKIAKQPYGWVPILSLSVLIFILAKVIFPLI